MNGTTTRISRRRSAFVLVAALGVPCVATGTEAQPPRTFTIEQALSAPFPTELTSAPVTGAMAWVFDSVGRQNVWVATPPDYVPRRVTDYAADDGQEITNLRWLADASGLVFVRGGGPNAAGEIPNPALEPGGVEQEIWLVPAAGGTGRKLGTGNGVAVGPARGPAADRVAFIHGDQVWWTSATVAGPAEQLLHTRGVASTLRWSPDGAALAFVSVRTDHSFIGLYDVATRTLRYAAPGVDRDSNPVWSPDGRRIAFVRIPAQTRTNTTGARRVGRPWSLWVADVGTGNGRQVWVADDGSGSVFHGLDAFDSVCWMASGLIVFPWERDGWLHLYSVRPDDASRRAAVVLTPGAFEVENAAMMPARNVVIFSSNQDDPERRHVWRLSLGRSQPGVPVAVTRGAGIEWAPAPLDGDGAGVALLRSDARTPARPAVLTSTSGVPRDITVLPAEFPSAALVVPVAVTFPAADGHLVHGQLFLPPDVSAGSRRPAVIFFHGGPRRQMLLGFHYMYYYHNSYAFNQYLANRGYVVLSVNYRSGIGYGELFREALNFGPSGASEYADVQGAGSYLRSRGDVDASRIGLWGGSYGGYLTAMGLARGSDMFAAGVDMHGVHDWNLQSKALVPGWDTERDLAARRVAFAASPMSSIASWRSPVLLIHGDDDRNVPFSQTVQLTEDLRAQGVAVETLVFPDEIHDFLTYEHWTEAYHAAAAFLDRVLSQAKPARP